MTNNVTPSKTILVIGTGTIGEPLIGLLADFKDELGIENVLFHKRTPLEDEIAKVESLCNKGASLVVNEDQYYEFKKLGHHSVFDFSTALQLANVVIDCTPAGNKHKKKHFIPKCVPAQRFIAQGSEKDFGPPFAYGINNEVLETNKNFIQVVSCNTHNICAILHSLDNNLDNIASSDFVCIRRANDISQDENFIASPEVGRHSSRKYGTHHAKDVYDLFRTKNKSINIFSSALKVNSQYMHIIRFDIKMNEVISKEEVLQRFRENKFIATTKKQSANKVFSFGRDHGYYGRIFNQTVIAESSLIVNNLFEHTRISGFCFTPQDGNSLLSSVAAALHTIHGEKYTDYMKIFDKFLFDTI